MSEYGNLWQQQAAWLVPCVAMTLLGFTGAFAAAQSTTGCHVGRDGLDRPGDSPQLVP